MATKTLPWVPSEHLDGGTAIAAYLEAAFDDGDPKLIAAALGDVARSRGMAEVAEKAGLSRESLYRSLSHNGNPELATILKVTRALGLHITVQSQTAAAE